ncbi:peptide antibiotic transporter SbmA [Mesorhizobium sp. J428]|uniref:peptide antibiotic transporter SbmA n=1 Tax=Mesorhizobium sp. J428 TaxID=2898440 RepID=UPI002151B608|nr:peptide antibiotic transporter SbmA [Mesorhizobium sp. J428]MCR5858670.1 peptide antibiotic transporter SbmA [Mesorhizobium sp. J428]
MFVSFFPKPKLFFISAVGWAAVMILAWYFAGEQLGAALWPAVADAEAARLLNPLRFITAPFIWFYVYFWLGVLLFYLFWRWYSPHPWLNWSVLGTALIIFAAYFNVQVSVALNDWRGPFYDLIVKALTPPASVELADVYSGAGSFLALALVGITVSVLSIFFSKHYIFRWRTAMNDFYVANWERLRRIEGASQRVQEDTMRFSEIMQSMGDKFVDSIMTLIAFTPQLILLSASVSEIPILGAIPYPLVFAAIGWALFGTVLLAVVGVRLPGLEFRNQRVEAAFRKELVYGEDDPTRAQPITLTELFANVRRNYFTLYAHYVYFDVTRYLYLQTDVIFATLILAPSIAAAKFSFGVYQQIVSAFTQVTNSFQYLVNSWPTIVTLISIYKRLRAFEATLDGEALPEIDRRYLEREAAGMKPEDQPAS